MLVAVMVIFVVCWTPSLLFDFSEAITKIFSQEAGTAYWIHLIGMWLNFLSMCNSCGNVFIYYWASELVFFLIFQMQNLTILQHLLFAIICYRAIKLSMQGMVKVNTWVFILRRYKWHIHAGSWSLVNCWREGSTLPYKGCS